MFKSVKVKVKDINQDSKKKVKQIIENTCQDLSTYSENIGLCENVSSDDY